MVLTLSLQFVEKEKGKFYLARTTQKHVFVIISLCHIENNYALSSSVIMLRWKSSLNIKTDD